MLVTYFSTHFFLEHLGILLYAGEEGKHTSHTHNFGNPNMIIMADMKDRASIPQNPTLNSLIFFFLIFFFYRQNPKRAGLTTASRAKEPSNLSWLLWQLAQTTE